MLKPSGVSYSVSTERKSIIFFLTIRINSRQKKKRFSTEKTRIGKTFSLIGPN